MASPTAVTFATMTVASLALISVRSSLIMPRRRATPRNTRSYRGLNRRRWLGTPLLIVAGISPQAERSPVKVHRDRASCI